MTDWFRLRALLAVLIVCGAPVVNAQPVEVLLFDEPPMAGLDHYVPSLGHASGGDELTLRSSDHLPLNADESFSGAVSGLLQYQHQPGGIWDMTIWREDQEDVDLAGFDSLILYVNGPASIPGRELPTVALESADGARRQVGPLSIPRNVAVDAASSGFIAGSSTNVSVSARYVAATRADTRRPGYPEDLLVTFSDEPLDTSVAGIGAPAQPANFRVESESGLRLDFRFRDPNADGTLSGVDEYIEVLMPESEGSDEQSPVWRLEPGFIPDPLMAPGAGDVYRLAVSHDAFELDADPSTWQRISLPLSRMGSDRDAVLASAAAVIFSAGGVNPETRTLWIDRISAVQNDDESFLEMVQRATFDYFWLEANPANGLVKDRSTATSASSIAAVGFALSAYTVGIERGWITREEGRERVLTTLRFFWNAPQGTASDATGYKGFFYHFLNMNTGRRAGTTELSTIDTALLMGGVLHMATYFTGDHPDEVEIRQLANDLYERVDWQWAQARPPAISHGWRPESGFIQFDWIGYNEAMILYILALGSPTYPVDENAWSAWTNGYAGQWQTHYGFSFLTFPPLFGHQYSHVWIDFRGIQDAYMRGRGIDYFENSRRATLAQRAYHIANPQGWPNYGENEWGLTASDTPTGYAARGAPPAQNDDGTLVPTAPGGSVPFAPDETIAALRHMYETYTDRLWGPYGFRDAYNVSANWFDPVYLGIDQGPILLMIENFRTEQIWREFMTHEAVIRGLVRAGFEGEPLADEPPVSAPAGLSLDVYPNPTKDNLQVILTADGPGTVRLRVFDLLGREVAMIAERAVAAGTVTLDWSAVSLPAGVYYVQAEAGRQVVVRPFVRIR